MRENNKLKILEGNLNYNPIKYYNHTFQIQFNRINYRYWKKMISLEDDLMWKSIKIISKTY